MFIRSGAACAALPVAAFAQAGASALRPQHGAVAMRARALAAIAAALCAVIPSVVRADVAGTVRGSVRDGAGRPLVASVELRSERGVVQTQRSDESGRFAFVRVPFGRYVIRAGAASAQVDVASGAVVDVALVPPRTIGRTIATSTGVRGTPVSETSVTAARLATLPRNDRLDAVVETAPGVVRFSYDEPVAHGFHGMTYELDGAPLPQTSSSAFAQLVDPRNAAAVEIFTGAFPAEFGGSRQGAVVNVRSGIDDMAPESGVFTLSGGTLGTADVRVARAVRVGHAQVALAIDTQRNARGLDTPQREALHDEASSSTQFLRVALPLGERDVIAADLSNAFANYQIPSAASGADDVQREYDRFAALSYTHTSRDGNGFFRFVPWARANRVAYDGDLEAAALSATKDGLRQDRAATTGGLRATVFRSGEHHALRAGVDVQRTSLRGTTRIRIAGQPDFVDAPAATGSQTGAYVEDRWALSRRVAVNAGLRYDASTGYARGSQLSPRFEINLEAARGTILHAYAGRLYAAPNLEDTRRDAVVTGSAADATPRYDLQPERDTYVELGLARTFAPGLRATFNAFSRTAVNVLDTTQLANTPLFAVFNNAVGKDQGLEFRFDGTGRALDASLSLTYQRARAGGVSGGTFLFPPDAAGDITLQPEDHDQTWTANGDVSRRFGGDLRTFVTLGAEYGTGFPVQFENGEGRLPARWIVNAAFGRLPAARSFGWRVDVDNAFDHRYPIKINNGFNTTQWNAPRRVVLRLSAPF